jgi:hypothetical protein
MPKRYAIADCSPRSARQLKGVSRPTSNRTINGTSVRKGHSEQLSSEARTHATKDPTVQRRNMISPTPGTPAGNIVNILCTYKA